MDTKKVCGVFSKTSDLFAAILGETETKVYSRTSYPLCTQAERRLASYAHAEEAALFNSGMAAIAAVMTSIVQGKVKMILASNCLYPKTRVLIEELIGKLMGVELIWSDPAEERFYQMVSYPSIDLVFVEIIGNGPAMPVADIPRLLEIMAKENRDLHMIVDNTFLTPALYSVMALADEKKVTDRVVVVESGTKYYQYGRDLVHFGMIYGPEDIIREVKKTRTWLGSILPEACLLQVPQNIFSIRGQGRIMVRHSTNAHYLANQLKHEKSGQVISIRYPFGGILNLTSAGGVLFIQLKGGPEAVEQFCDTLKYCKIGTSFGHSYTWVFPWGALPLSGFASGYVRVAVGWEQDINEVIADFQQALARL
ncbi:MAG: PLP-dependent transferase [Patescibacteria group bacterium]